MNCNKDTEVRFREAQAAFSARKFSEAIKKAQLVTENIDACFDKMECGKGSDTPVKYSIIVLNYKHSDAVEDMLRFLEKYNRLPNYEIIIVNNGNSKLKEATASHLSRHTYIECRFNLGCSGGRNVGALNAQGEYILFIDDDGKIGEDSIEALISCITETNAVGVRGRIEALSPGATVGTHYDKGTAIVESIPDAEGMSIWQKEIFLEFGGFDILLSGHEGLRLYCEFFRFHGPHSFLYTPYAVLYHDFADGPEHRAHKEALHKKNLAYLSYLELNHKEIASHLNRRHLDKNTRLLPKRTVPLQTNGTEPISIITTIHNGAAFIDDFLLSLKKQTYRNFHLIVVDDGSTDASVKLLTNHQHLPKQFTLLEEQHIGRSAALNLALSKARTDICLIADIDDISLPNRFQLTVDYLTSDSSLSMISFVCFNEVNFLFSSPPRTNAPMSIISRSLIGMPVAFPTFAFRKSDFLEEFNINLQAGVDCDWINRNILAGCRDGLFIPSEQVYYRRHDHQISAGKREKQKKVAIECAIRIHSRIFGMLTEEDKKQVAYYTRWEAMHNLSQLNLQLEYCSRLVNAIYQQDDFDPASTSAAVHDAYSELENIMKFKHASSKYGESSYGFFGWRRIFIPFARIGVKFIGGTAKIQEFDKDPVAFLANLQENKYKIIRRILFPQ